MSVQGEAAKTARKAMGEVFENVLHSNEAIIKAFDDATGLKTFAKELLTEEGSRDLTKAIEKAGYYTTNEAGKKVLNASKIAGAYVGLSAAGRIATGGGLYKDRNGNTNLIGLPII